MQEFPRYTEHLKREWIDEQQMSSRLLDRSSLNKSMLFYNLCGVFRCNCSTGNDGITFVLI